MVVEQANRPSDCARQTLAIAQAVGEASRNISVRSIVSIGQKYCDRDNATQLVEVFGSSQA